MPCENCETSRLRIDELETRMLFLDDNLNALNDALATQQKLIMQLERSMEKMLERIDEANYQASDPASEPPPPHY